MAMMLGFSTVPVGYGSITAALSSALRGLTGQGWPAMIASSPSARIGCVMTGGPVQANGQARAGYVLPSYQQDYYNRIHLSPPRIALGNLVSEQTRMATLWNAWRDRTVTAVGTDTASTDGIVLTAPAALPIIFAPLQERTWIIAARTDGPPVIDARITWRFDAGIVPQTVVITGNRLIAWMLPPDWSSPVTETLEWLTDVQTAIDGREYREPCRAAPRRQWEFGIVAAGQDRQILEAALFDWSGRTWALPVWPDVSWLATELAAGAVSVPVATAGLDFRTGGLAMLWIDTQHYELMEVKDVAVDALTIAQPVSRRYPAGTRIMPCRSARLTDTITLARHSDQVSTGTVRFEAVEPCDWPAIPPATTYLGLPVFEQRSDETNAGQATLARQTTVLDGDVGGVDVLDPSGLAWPTQRHDGQLRGRASRATHRSLLYALQGRAGVIWLPTWTADVTLLAPLSATSTTMAVAWMGAVRHLRNQAGRRHLRIALVDGRVFYRRAAPGDATDPAREQLALDSALGIDVVPDQVRQISWLALSRLAGDRVEIAHRNDSLGLATVTVTFAGVPGEEP